VLAACSSSPKKPAPDSGATETANDTSSADDVRPADLIVNNSLITTQDTSQPSAEALAVKDGVILAVGSNEDIEAFRSPETVVIDGEGRRMLPGLNDNHLHVFSAGHKYNYNVRWDGVPSLALALERLAVQAERTPDGQWVKAIGGWSPHQFEEGRLPTMAELNEAVPEHPLIVQHAYNIALMNQAALAAIGADSPHFWVPPDTTFERDADGHLTGRVIGEPASWIFWMLEFMVPQPTPEEQKNSLLQLFTELNRMGITSLTDAGASELYPNTPIVTELMTEDRIPLRVSFLELPLAGVDAVIEATTVTAPISPGENIHPAMSYGFQFEGVGEMVHMDFENFQTHSDWENFTQPVHVVDGEQTRETIELEVSKLVALGYPFRLHVTYDENIGPILDGLENVHAATPLDGLRWSLEHAETISPTNIDRVHALGGALALQGRMALHGDDFAAQHGESAALYSPPIRAIADSGVPLSLGTDGLRTATYNPWLTLAWATTGRSISGSTVLAPDNRLTRAEALQAYTLGSAWHQGQEGIKGRLAVGQLADFILLTDDYFAVPDDSIANIHSVLTVVGGAVVYGEEAYAGLAPVVPEPIPNWSPVNDWPGYYTP